MSDVMKQVSDAERLIMHEDHDEQMIKWWLANGYLHIRKMPDGEYAALYKFMFTWAIIHELDYAGYGNRWCYHSYDDALKAFNAWDGTGEPTGWHRHPGSGRRRDQQGNEYVNW